MEIEYQYTPEDFFEFNKSYCIYGFKRRILLILILAFFIPSFSVNGKSFDSVQYWISAGIIMVVLSIVSYFLPLITGSIKIRKMLAKEPQAFEKKKLTIADEGLLIESESTSGIRLWESLKSAGSINKFIYIKLADKRALMLPDRLFNSDTERTNFLSLVQSKIAQIKRQPNAIVRNKKNNPSMYWCLGCLIPAIGAVIGVIMIADGASRYKQKWYLPIGLGGILFTALCAIMLVKPVNRVLARQWVVFAQIDVNTLMKDVEFYKMRHGVYPDRLEQLQKDDQMAPIYDAIILVQLPGNRKIKYNYQNAGNHYYLFSSGVDGIPGTADDIYPQVSKSDSGKFGLIHK